VRLPTRIALLFVAAFLGAGATVATASGPSISEFSTGLTPSIGLWGIAQGSDGNLWVVDGYGKTRVTTAAAPTFDEFGAGNSGRGR